MVNRLSRERWNSIAIGNRAKTEATANESIALGTDAYVGEDADGSIAFGSDAEASEANSVALGADSVADRGALFGVSVGEVSVGSDGNERQITNVAAGTEDTDAVNWPAQRGRRRRATRWRCCMTAPRSR